MFIKKSTCILLSVIMGLSPLSLASASDTRNIDSNNEASSILLQLSEDEEESLIAQRYRYRRGGSSRYRRPRRRLSRPRPGRPIRRAYRRERRRQFRRDLRNEARRYRRRDAAGRIITGVVGAGIGAAIAESNRNNRRNTETIIIDRGRGLRDRDYYEALYQCRYLEQGGYYDADELEDCLRRN